MIRELSLCSLFAFTGIAALSTGCDDKKVDSSAMTSTKDTPGNVLLTSSDASVPSNPRGVTMKGAPAGSTVSGEEPANPGQHPLKNQQ